MESIYNFVPRPQAERGKDPMYRSKYDPKAPLTGSTFGLRGTTVTVGKGMNYELKKTCVISSTFGPPNNTSAANPSNFLKKGTREQGPKSSAKYKCKASKAEMKPPVPERDEKPIMGLKTCKNFVTYNAAKAVLSIPPNVKDDGGGFMEKENYGEVPDYLAKVKNEINRENEIIDQHVKQQLEMNKEPEPEYVQMDEAERQQLIRGLKRKWDAVNSNYQKICHRVTIENCELKRKEAQEAELQQLEDDIEKLSRPGPLMIRK